MSVADAHSDRASLSRVPEGVGIATATAVVLVVVAVLLAACSDRAETVATVDAIELSVEGYEALVVDPDDLNEDEQVGNVLLLVLRQAFATRASADLGIEPSARDVDAAYDVLIEPIEARGSVTDVLAARNQTEARIRINAELDVLRREVGEHLVRAESDFFDLVAAEQAFTLANAEVCIRQIQFDDVEDVAPALDRLADGEPFASVARDVSIDPFAQRQEGVGAGGDLGCSAPNALPPGLDTASLQSTIDEPTGPITSSVGVHVLEVYQRSTPDLVAEHDDVVEAAVAVQSLVVFNRWAVDTLRSIEVDVDSSYGRWGVLPETDPVPTVVPPYRFRDITDNTDITENTDITQNTDTSQE